MTNDQYLLLKACEYTLNHLRNTRLPHHPIYKDTYQLASAVTKELVRYEEEMNSINKELYNEDARSYASELIDGRSDGT